MVAILVSMLPDDGGAVTNPAATALDSPSNCHIQCQESGSGSCRLHVLCMQVLQGLRRQPNRLGC